MTKLQPHDDIFKKKSNNKQTWDHFRQESSNRKNKKTNFLYDFYKLVLSDFGPEKNTISRPLIGQEILCGFQCLHL